MAAETRLGRSNGRSRSRPAGLASVLALGAIALITGAVADQPISVEAPGCDKVGTWLVPATGETIAPDRLLASLAKRPVVLLGETHDNAEHHRWQLQMLAALHGYKPHLIIGFETFPRRVQPALNQWVNGELHVEAFLKAVEWREVSGYDPALYLPLFHFARQNRVPMVALNVDRELVSRVRRQGWASIPADERAGLSDPAPPSKAYQESLARVFADEHAREANDTAKEEQQAETAPAAPHSEADISSIMQSEDFARFVEAQLTWDRAMAEALVEARHREPGSLVVGVVGRGHMEYGHGVPHQLEDLGISEGAILLPIESPAACDELPADLADAVFIVEPARHVEPVRPKPRLGVLIKAGEGGVRILEVLEGSVAEATALASDDIVVSAAGFPIKRVSDLIEIVQRQAPGTWLPLKIRRNGKYIEVVAKFPTKFESPE